VLELVILVAVVGVGWQAVRHARSRASERSKLAVVGVTAAAAAQLVRLPGGPYLPLALLIGVYLYIEYLRATGPHPAEPSGPSLPHPPNQD
jgi:hypothetical protein